MSKDRRDFGRGFYTTAIKEQAFSWAKSMIFRFGGPNAYLYEFTFQSTPKMNIKHFHDLSIEWLEMIKTNRVQGGIQHDFDVVIGPVANDNTFRTVALYMEGDYTAEQAIEQLRYFKPNNQLSIHTELALSGLTFVRRDRIE